MKPAVVSASCHPPKAGAVLGVTNGCLLPMAPWVALGPWLGFVRGTFRFLLPPLQTAHFIEQGTTAKWLQKMHAALGHCA